MTLEILLIVVIGIIIGAAAASFMMTRRYRTMQHNLQSSWLAESRLALDKQKRLYDQRYFSVQSMREKQGSRISRNAQEVACLEGELENSKVQLAKVLDAIRALESTNAELDRTLQSCVASNYLLHLASIGDHVEYAKMALSKNADVNYQVNGEGCVNVATKCGSSEVTRLLLRNDANPNSMPDLDAADSLEVIAKNGDEPRASRNSAKCPKCSSVVAISYLEAHIARHGNNDRSVRLPKSDVSEDIDEGSDLIADRTYDRLDASKDWGYIAREDGRFGSYPEHDDYGDESGNKDYS